MALSLGSRIGKLSGETKPGAGMGLSSCAYRRTLLHLVSPDRVLELLPLLGRRLLHRGDLVAEHLDFLALKIGTRGPEALAPFQHDGEQLRAVLAHRAAHEPGRALEHREPDIRHDERLLARP